MVISGLSASWLHFVLSKALILLFSAFGFRYVWLTHQQFIKTHQYSSGARNKANKKDFKQRADLILQTKKKKTSEEECLRLIWRSYKN